MSRLLVLGATGKTYTTGKMMLQPITQKITVTCPAGHRLRGNSNLVGKKVKCPKCDHEFTFALTFQRSNGGDNKPVTDTGVMRILGTMDAVPPAPKKRVKTERPCNRCGTLLPESAAVCNRCNCYVGVLPSFMNEISASGQDTNSSTS